jgi:lysozyme family protein
MTTARNPKVWAGLGALVVAVVAGVLGVEGGYVNDPNDAGGATNHGITEQTARAHGYTGPMQSLPEGMAQQIYVATYIEAPGFDRVLALSPAVGTKLVDYGVNAGPARAVRAFQSALADLSRGGRDYPPPAIDGVIGTRTLAAYSALQQRRGIVKACELTLKLLDGQQAVYYSVLAKGHANASFLVGWLDHRIGNVPLARCAERVEGAA